MRHVIAADTVYALQYANQIHTYIEYRQTLLTASIRYCVIVEFKEWSRCFRFRFYIRLSTMC